MTWRDRVIWAEGMFLQPQHFQQHDRHLDHQRRLLTQQLQGHAWGFSSVQLDEAALQLGKIALVNAQGLTPDGVAFSVPASDAAPPALDIPADVRNELVVLALVLQRPGVVETDAEQAAGSMGPRFAVSEVNVADSNASIDREAPIQVGRLNLRLMLARDARDGYASMAIARVVERRADNRLMLDTTLVPPLLHAGAHVVTDGYLRELCGLLHQRGEALASRLAAPGRGGVGEIADFLLLQTVNRHQARFNHLQTLPLLHPERLYSACVELAGELAVFRESRRPSRYADYQHDELALSFRPVMDELRQSLSMVLEQTAIPIELQERKYGVRVALIPDVQLQRTAVFVLAVSAQLPGDALRARFPTQVKIGPVEKIRDLVNLQLPGVTLRPLPVAPRQIPYHAGHHYFELETTGNELWKQVETSGGLALHVAGDFPGLVLEFWAIRG
jgi:type VI secretion system protein ImpJ